MPAIILIVVSILAIFVGLLGFAADIYLVASGILEQLEEVNQGAVSEKTQILIRTVWGIILVMASSFVLYGAFKMLRMTNYGAARAAAIVAVIPCVGPCCIVGIPFGVWALVVLNRPEVKNAFR